MIKMMTQDQTHLYFDHHPNTADTVRWRDAILSSDDNIPVVVKLSRTSNFIGSCWHKALLL